MRISEIGEATIERHQLATVVQNLTQSAPMNADFEKKYNAFYDEIQRIARKPPGDSKLEAALSEVNKTYNEEIKKINDSIPKIASVEKTKNSLDRLSTEMEKAIAKANDANALEKDRAAPLKNMINIVKDSKLSCPITLPATKVDPNKAWLKTQQQDIKNLNADSASREVLKHVIENQNACQELKSTIITQITAQQKMLETLKQNQQKALETLQTKMTEFIKHSITPMTIHKSNVAASSFDASKTAAPKPELIRMQIIGRVVEATPAIPDIHTILTMTAIDLLAKNLHNKAKTQQDVNQFIDNLKVQLQDVKNRHHLVTLLSSTDENIYASTIAILINPKPALDELAHAAKRSNGIITAKNMKLDGVAKGFEAILPLLKSNLGSDFPIVIKEIKGHDKEHKNTPVTISPTNKLATIINEIKEKRDITTTPEGLASIYLLTHKVAALQYKYIQTDSKDNIAKVKTYNKLENDIHKILMQYPAKPIDTLFNDVKAKLTEYQAGEFATNAKNTGFGLTIGGDKAYKEISTLITDLNKIPKLEAHVTTLIQPEPEKVQHSPKHK